MGRRGALRASDSDREQATERLRRAAAEGRLLGDELEQRLAAALRARTLSDLDPLLADLPGRKVGPGSERRRPRVAIQVLSAAAIGLAVLSVMALVVMVMTGLFAVWALWAMFAWFFFGRGRRGPGGHRAYGPLRPGHRRLL